MPTATVNGVKINYDLQGEPGRETLILTHGLGGHLGNWLHQVPALSREFQVLTWDMRGFGASDRPPVGPGVYTRHAMASDLSGLLKALGIPAAHVLGHSLGGLVAQQFALSYPDQTLSLIVVDSSAEIREQYLAGWDEQVAILCEKGLAALQEDPSISWSEGFRQAHPEVIEAMRRDSIARNDPLVYAEGARIAGRELFEDPLAPHIGRISCPALIVCGEEDRLTPPGGSVRMSRASLGAKLAILPGAGHFATLEIPETLNDTILQFLRSLPR